MTIRMDSKQFAAYHRRLAKNFKPTLLKGIRAGASRVVALMADRTRQALPANPAGVGTGGAVNTGAYLRSWKMLPIPEGAEVLNASPYAAIIEYGRRAGAKFPPKQALIEWIKRKIVGPQERAKRTKARDDRAKKNNPQRPPTTSERARSKNDDGRARPPEPPRAPRPKAFGPRRQVPSNVDKIAARLYFPIARAIARRGLIARKILTAEDIQERIRGYVHAECVRELDKEINKP